MKSAFLLLMAFVVLVLASGCGSSTSAKATLSKEAQLDKLSSKFKNDPNNKLVKLTH